MASYDPQGNPYQTSPPPRSGMSTATKVVLILVVVLGGLGLLCCGGLFYFGSQFAKAMSQDPAVVQQVTQKLATITIPEPLKPVMSMDMEIFSVKMTGVAYGDKASQSALKLMSMGANGAESDPTQMRVQLEPQLDNFLRQQGIDPQSMRGGNWDSQTSTKAIKIHDQEVSFQFSKQTNKENGDVRLGVEGSFPGNEGSVSLVLSVDTKAVSEEQVVQMLESIK